MKNYNIFEEYKDNQDIAKNFLWKKLCKWRLQGIINEIEIYKWWDDPASHAFCGKTKRNRPMFENWGCIYVYMIYGMYYCFNISIWHKWQPWAVLIRSIIPTNWIQQMTKNRNFPKNSNLTNWPGKICQSFKINKEYNWKVIWSNNCNVKIQEWIQEFNIISTSRVWIQKWTDKKRRFFIKNTELN